MAFKKKVSSRVPRVTEDPSLKVPESIDQVILTAEEQQLFDPEFLRESVARAVAAVQRLEDQRTMRISRVLAMRDVLFARWLRQTVAQENGELELADPEQEINDLLGEIDAELPSSIELPEVATAYQRVTQFAAERDLSIKEYLRFVEAFDGMNRPIGEHTPDNELDRLFELVRVREP